MAQQGTDVDIFGSNPCIVTQFVDRVGDPQTFDQEFCKNLQLLRLDQHNRKITGPFAYLDTEKLLNISSNTLHNFDGSTEVLPKPFLLFFLLSDWLKLNHLKVEWNVVFQTFFRAIIVPP